MTQARKPPLIQGAIGPEGHWFTTKGKQLTLTNPVGTALAGKTPRQKRTAASLVNSHYSLIGELRLRATTRVDHPGYAAPPSDRSLVTPIPWLRPAVLGSGTRRWTIPTKTPRGHQSSVAAFATQKCNGRRYHHAKLIARSVRRAIRQRLTVDLPNVV